MTQILIIAEHHNGKLNSSTAKCVTAAKQMKAAAIHIAVFAAEPASVASEAARNRGRIGAASRRARQHLHACARPFHHIRQRLDAARGGIAG
jgi:electron transfer flavoprotein alpha subunit